MTPGKILRTIVLMDEQFVRDKEQLEKNEGAAASAPMVERAFRLLELLGSSEDGLTFSEMARTLQMSKGGLHGLLKTLENRDVVEQETRHRYVLGPHIYELAGKYVQRTGLRRLALPAMHRLASSIGETVCLGRVEERTIRVLECVTAPEENMTLHVAVKRNQRLPLLAGALSCCVLANWPLEQRESFVHAQSLPRFTERSVTDPVQLLERVEETVRTGVSMDHGEYLDGVNAIAASIYGLDGTFLAPFWIVGFASRLKGEMLDRAAHQLYAEALAISQALGPKNHMPPGL